MVLTKAQKQAVIKHVIENIFGEDPNCDLYKVMAFNKIRSPLDLIAKKDNWFDSLQFHSDPSDKTTLTDLAKGDAGLLKSFKAYILHQTAFGIPIEDSDWLQITEQNFNNFHIIFVVPSTTFAIKRDE